MPAEKEEQQQWEVEYVEREAEDIDEKVKKYLMGR